MPPRTSEWKYSQSLGKGWNSICRDRGMDLFCHSSAPLSSIQLILIYLQICVPAYPIHLVKYIQITDLDF